MIENKIQRGFSIHPDALEILKNIRFVMTGITHPGNIGATARAMKNMGLSKLVIVDSADFGPSTDAFSMASGAYGIVEAAQVAETLEEALVGAIMSIGTSGRLSGQRLHAKTPEELIPELLSKAQLGKVTIVFGRESRGLTNDEMKLCTHHLIIPTASVFASMNVAAAAAIVGYEIFKVSSRPVGFQAKKFTPASSEVREQMFDHIEQTLLQAGFLNGKNPLRMMREIRRILNGADLDDRDATIIRGVFRKIGNMIRISNERKSSEE